MTNSSRRIQVPKTPRESFDPDRPASDLDRSQALHLREALFKHLQAVAEALAIDPRSLETESEFSDYAQRVTAILHPHVVKGATK